MSTGFWAVQYWSVSGLLCDRPHWLHVPERVGYKLHLLVFKAVHGTALENPSELCQSNAEDAARSRLRSAGNSDLQVPRSKTNFGDGMFLILFLSPRVWAPQIGLHVTAPKKLTLY